MEILNLERNAFEEAVEQKGFPRYKARQIFKWIYDRHIYSFENMSDISKHDREQFAVLFSITPLNVPQIIVSKDGTEKLVFQLDDGAMIESVIIPDEKRNTLCVSTQVGCPLKCSFCKTGSLGFKRDLSVREITGQVLRASEHLGSKGKRITNIVYMGMGEPLLNFDSTVLSVKILLDDQGFCFSNRKLTVSTVGITDRIVELGKLTSVNLAVSLHAVNDEKREKIIPANKKYPLSGLLKAIKEYPAHQRKKVVLEYVMLKGFNDTAEDAKKLLKIARDVDAKVNLIPFNNFEGSGFEATQRDDIVKFQAILSAGKVTAHIRRSRGYDELAACGQLGKVI